MHVSALSPVYFYIFPSSAFVFKLKKDLHLTCRIRLSHTSQYFVQVLNSGTECYASTLVYAVHDKAKLNASDPGWRKRT